MNVREFMCDEVESIIRFKVYWEKMNAKRPDHFPKELSKEDWQEQYSFWKENN